MEDKIFESLAYAVPAIVTGAVAYFMFSGFVKQGTQEKQQTVFLNCTALVWRCV